ncbi:RNA-binding ATPase activator esf2 [Mortierella sp. AM989]|nr:RNA-binding ATPase activator esf2 [Mortierella sp. AM989]
MSTKLRTEDIFNLPKEDAHSDSSAYDSEEERENKGSAVKSTISKVSKKTGSKKKGIAVFGLGQDTDSEDDNDYSSQEEDEVNIPETADQNNTLDSRFQTKDEEDGNAKAERVRGSKKSKKVKPLTPEALEKFQAVRDKTGIVYLSKIPPFMKPVKLRHLLGQFGELGRVYLAPEDAKVAARRKKYGGNKKQNFTEGWVEFLDKSVAKQVANSLNTTIIGGNKNSYYHDDMWNIKYLPKFKWDHLTERIAYENASRAQRLQAEISQAKRENKFILNNIEKSKMIKNMEEKKAAKRKTSEGEGTSGGAASETGEGKIRRAFKQRRLGEGEQDIKRANVIAAPVQGKIKSVLGNVFGR